MFYHSLTSLKKKIFIYFNEIDTQREGHRETPEHCSAQIYSGWGLNLGPCNPRHAFTSLKNTFIFINEKGIQRGRHRKKEQRALISDLWWCWVLNLGLQSLRHESPSISCISTFRGAFLWYQHLNPRLGMD